MADYDYDKIKPAPVRTDDKELQRFAEDVRRALEEIYKVIKKLVDSKQDA
jgi:hypothetical protein